MELNDLYTDINFDAVVSFFANTYRQRNHKMEYDNLDGFQKEFRGKYFPLCTIVANLLGTETSRGFAELHRCPGSFTIGSRIVN
jgi:hypothetical protein